MLIVAGHLQVAPGRQADYLTAAAVATGMARVAPGCLEFVQAADPLEPDRIVIYERWETEEHLLAFRALDTPADAPELPPVVGADVKRYEISSVGPA